MSAFAPRCMFYVTHQFRHNMNEVIDANIETRGLSRSRYLLAHWQSMRLAATYADLAADQRYGQATEFFLADLYGPRDFSKRDRDGERVVAKMRTILPARAMAAIQRALHLNKLSQMLDAEMADMLFETMRVDAIDTDNYAESYRRCNRFIERREQIALVDVLGRELDVLVSKSFVRMALKLAHGPAYLAGLGELQDFLERGVAAFSHMNGASYFLQTICRRESMILDRIECGDCDPFRL